MAKSSNPVFSDDLVCEVPPTNFRQLHLYVCEQSSGRVPHPFLRLSLKKSDIIKVMTKSDWEIAKSGTSILLFHASRIAKFVAVVP